MTTSFTVRSLLLAGGLAVAAAGAANASPPGADVPAVKVQYTMATLTTESGTQALYHRLVKAAERVCEEQHISGSPFPSESEMKCREEAVAGAVEKIHNPRLVALFTGKTKAG
jgi:UrcA family protein